MIHRGGAISHGHAQKVPQAPQRAAMSGAQSCLRMQRKDVNHPCNQLQCVCIANAVSSSAGKGSWGWFSPARSAPVNFHVLSSSTCKQPENELPPISLTRASFHDRTRTRPDASSASPYPSKASKVKSCMVSKACDEAKAAQLGHLLGFQNHTLPNFSGGCAWQGIPCKGWPCP